MKGKKRELITAFMIQLIITLPFYTASVYGLTISEVNVSKTTGNSATIEWKTDVPSNGRVEYGETFDLGFISRHENFIIEHRLVLQNGLTSDSDYFFIVRSNDANGTMAVDNNSNSFYSFRTKDINPPPKVTGLVAPSVNSDSVALSWDSVEISDLMHYVVYRNLAPVATVNVNTFNDTGLSPNTEFVYKVSAVDTTNNEGKISDGISVFTAIVDKTPPVITNVDDLPLSDSTTLITWITDENATSLVLYGVNQTGNYRDNSKSSNALEINHSITIGDLAKNVMYTYTVISCDKANNCANSSNHSFISTKDLAPPLIDLTLPQCVNRRIIDLSGSTEPFSKVTLYVNDMDFPKRIIGKKELDKNGNFIFSQIQLEETNKIKLVIEDKSGNRNEKLFDVRVDTSEPALQLDEIVSITSKSNLSLSGTVSEPVSVKIFIQSNANDSSTPPKIEGLNVTKVGQNSVELHWNEVQDKDFTNYVVYRSGIGPIATTKPSDFNFYIDALVDSAKSYTYQVSAVNVFAVEGQKSDEITASTLPGGAILGLTPPLVDIFEDFRKPVLAFNASGKFSFGVRLPNGDKEYRVKAVFEDCAGNSVIAQKDVVLDTKKPDIELKSPPSGAMIFENVANNVDVIGKTKPNARVHLFIDRTPFSSYDFSAEVSGLPNEAVQTPESIFQKELSELAGKIDNISEDSIDVKCHSVIAGLCPTGADYSTTADSQGNFRFSDVDLTVMFGGAFRAKKVSPSNFRDTALNRESTDSKKTTLVLIATDEGGLRKSLTRDVRIGTCWSGNQSWDIIPLQQYQTPHEISTERLVEGTEQIGFYFNFSYIGPGTRPTITGVTISKACSDKEVRDPRFNISCQIMPPGITAKSMNQPENTVWYANGKLGRFQNMDRFLENDWKGFFKSINNEFSFPLKVRILYKHDINNDGTLEGDTQTTCEQVSYIVDNHIIDPRKVLPQWLLKDFPEFLNDASKTLTKVKDQLDKLIQYVGASCLLSFGLNLALQFNRRWVGFFEEKKFAVGAGKFSEALEAFKVGDGQNSNEQECKEIIKQIEKERGSFKLRYVNDIDLKKCFPAVSSAWKSEEKSYEFSRWSCDRIFGHSAPSRWTENKNDDELIAKVESTQGCEGDESEKGQPLKAEPCTDLARKNPKYREAAKLGDKYCVLYRTRGGEGGTLGGYTEAVFTVDSAVPGSDNLYRLSFVESPNALGERAAIYAVKSRNSDFDYTTAQSRTCDQICKDTYLKGKRVSNDNLVIEGKVANGAKDVKTGEGIYGECTTINKCRSLNVHDEKNKITYKNSNGVDMPIKSARTFGYTKDCFYDENKQNVRAVSGTLSEMEGCCCINTDNNKDKRFTGFYEPVDKDPITGGNVFETKDANDAGIQASLGENDFSKMKWSYRYYKEKFQTKGTGENEIHNKYNPKRYIDGRDLPACFGMNNLLYDGFSTDNGKALTVDPFKDYWAAFQCVHLAGVSNRITELNVLMGALSSCLIQVRETGRGDGAACKEIFTRYVCDTMWQAIRFFLHKDCVTDELDTNFDARDSKITDYLNAGFGGVYQSISDLQSEYKEEYGNAKLNDLLGSGEESVARKMCLAAFGYDWEINVKNLVDAAYSSPYSTNPIAPTRSREFLSVEPTTLKPKYEYRASWLIVPGCNFDRYDVYLSCVGRRQLDLYSKQIDCSSVGSPSIAYTGGIGKSQGFSECDCMQLPDEKLSPLFFSNKLKQNVLEDKSKHQIIDSNVRYDHLKFVLRPDRKIPANMRANCLPQGYDDGVFYFPLSNKGVQDLIDCRADPLSGSYSCGESMAFTTRKGIGEFIDITVNEVDSTRTPDLVFNAGDALKVDATIRSVGQNKCIRITYDNQAQIDEIFEGVQQYSYDLGQLTLDQRRGIGKLDGFDISPGILSNTQSVAIKLKFIDKNQNNRIDLDGGDTLEIDNSRIELDDLVKNRIQTVNSGPAQVRVTSQDGRIKLEKSGAEVIINDVKLKQDSNGNFVKDQQTQLFFNEGSILIPPQVSEFSINDQSQFSQQSTQKTLKIELLNQKENTEETGIAACALNDPVLGAGGKPQERTVRITVQQRPTDVSKSKPTIRETKSPPQFVRDNDVVIAATIIQNYGINKVTMECRPSIGDAFIPSYTQLENNYEFKISYSADLHSAGKYNCKLTALGNNQQSAEKLYAFEVQCSDGSKFGFCADDGKCCPSKGTTCPQENSIQSSLSCATRQTSQTQPPPAQQPQQSQNKPAQEDQLPN